MDDISTWCLIFKCEYLEAMTSASTKPQVVRQYGNELQDNIESLMDSILLLLDSEQVCVNFKQQIVESLFESVNKLDTLTFERVDTLEMGIDMNYNNNDYDTTVKDDMARAYAPLPMPQMINYLSEKHGELLNQIRNDNPSLMHTLREYLLMICPLFQYKVRYLLS